MTTRLVITLDATECSALGQLAEQELRDPREQIRFVLRQVLRKQGFLPGEETPETLPESEGGNDAGTN